MKIFSKESYYLWTGTQNGKKLSGEIKAPSMNRAHSRLHHKNIAIISLEKKPIKFFHFHNQTISSNDITIFLQQLSTLLGTGIPLVQSFEILIQSQTKMRFQTMLVAIKQELEAGKNLAEGLKKFPRYFDQLICYLIHAGEQTGTLSIMLQRAFEYQEKSQKLKNQIKQALLYPSVISCAAFVITFIMLTFVVPQFSILFQSMHSPLPAFTQFIFSLSIFLRTQAWILIFPFIGLAGTIFYYRKNHKQNMDRFILSIPLLNQFIQKNTLARLARALATIISSSIPITDALNIAANLCNNSVYESAVRNLQNQINAGNQLHVSMRQNYVFTPLFIHMVKIGEESGTLIQMLEKTALIYEADLDRLTKTLHDLLEPLIIMILGVLIGGLVIAMYLPIFKLGTVI